MYVSLEEVISLNMNLEVFLTWRHLRKAYPRLMKWGDIYIPHLVNLSY